jgi:undecaprenyl-diphosphatase
MSVLIGMLVTWLGTPELDGELLRRAASLRDGTFGDLLQLLTTIGYTRWFTAITVVSAILVASVTRRPLDGVVVAGTVLVARVMTGVLKQLFERARPGENIDEHALGFAMPSGHATHMAALVVSIALVCARGRHRPLVTAALVSIALLTALSRVVLAAHWPTDVLAGLLLGTGIALVVAAVAPPPRVRD